VSTHFINTCECGKVISQCRCFDLNKAKRTVSPCVHETGELVVEEEKAAEHLTAMDP
jgi:hypothetical protein